MKAIALLTIALCGHALVVASADPTQPHLAQGWTAQSTGDGLPGQIGQETYIYEEYPNKGGPAEGLRGHIFDYGASCKKIEVSPNSLKHPEGDFYIGCDGGLDCCIGDTDVDVKKWDIDASNSQITTKYVGVQDTTELNGKSVKNAEVWAESVKLPFTKFHVDYTYYITRNGSDIISHRIDFSAAGTGVNASTILYGNFQPLHNLTELRAAFMPPPACLKPNTLTCPSKKVIEWEKKYFKHSAARKGLF
jgi:hypothetical protein